MPTKRIAFTAAELALINDMCAIAAAAPWGEGDYADWTEDCTEVYNGLRDKVWDLLKRKGAPSASAEDIGPGGRVRISPQRT